MAKDKTSLSFNTSLSVFIDGNVRSFISTIPLIATGMQFRNVERFTVPGIYISQIMFGRPLQKIPDGYIDWSGSSNTVYRYSEGNVGKITIKNAIWDSVIYAGSSHFRVYTKDLAAVLSTYPPSGTIGSLKARLIAGTGDLSSYWESTTIISASSRPILKVAPGQIVTENTSVFITP